MRVPLFALNLPCRLVAMADALLGMFNIDLIFLPQVPCMSGASGLVSDDDTALLWFHVIVTIRFYSMSSPFSCLLHFHSPCSPSTCPTGLRLRAVPSRRSWLLTSFLFPIPCLPVPSSTQSSACPRNLQPVVSSLAGSRDEVPIPRFTHCLALILCDTEGEGLIPHPTVSHLSSSTSPTFVQPLPALQFGDRG
jgi:hypothetical protein